MGEAAKEAALPVPCGETWGGEATPGLRGKLSGSMKVGAIWRPPPDM